MRWKGGGGGIHRYRKQENVRDPSPSALKKKPILVGCGC